VLECSYLCLVDFVQEVGHDAGLGEAGAQCSGLGRVGGRCCRVRPAAAVLDLVDVEVGRRVQRNLRRLVLRVYTGCAKKCGHRLMSIILSDLNRFLKNSVEDSWVNL